MFAAMIAANIWHWWAGVLLFGVGVLATLALVVGYLKTVTAPRIPPESERARRRAKDL
jgi:hypothetical protein